ncbi:MAG TPA: hypothetical protein VIF62_28120 [Labilithrix sp.]|jgi:hypothetical protein
MTARAAFASFALACTLVAGAAHAQSTASAPAEKLFREGKALAASGDLEQAIAKFKASQDLEPSVGVLLSLGDAYRARGQVASAWGAYVAARDLARSRTDARVADAEARAADVKPRLPRLTVRVAPQGDVTVSDEGLTLPPASFGTSLPVDPGAHTIVATARGKRPFRATQTIGEAQAREIFVPVLQDDDAAAPRPLPEPPAEERHDDPQRTVGLGLVIGGGVATAAGFVLGAVAISKWSSVTAACPEKQCDTLGQRDAAESDARAASHFAAASTIGIVVGLVAIGAGFVLRMTAPQPSTVGAAP